MKYKVGDYLVADRTVFVEIQGAVDGVVEVYATTSVRRQGVKWMSLPELESKDLVPGKPDFAMFSTAQPGDYVYCGGDTYVRVLARVGNCVLLSEDVDSHKEAKRALDSMGDLLGGNFLEGRPEREELERLATNKYAHSAAGDWITVTDLALMNWSLVKDEK